MEPYGLKSLTDLLTHPYLVRNRLAETLYGESSNAVYTRLMSRAKGRHRFREEEAHGLIKIFERLAGRLERLADKLQGAEVKPADAKKLLVFPELNLKPVIDATLGQGRYLSFYERLRDGRTLPEGWLEAVAAELLRLAAQIRENADLARGEARQYPFSYGKGRISHLE